MVDLSGFDASQVPEQQDFSALPEGQYLVAAIASEKKPTKAGNGAYLNITFDVINGPYKGRKLWARINLWNASAAAVDIAKRELGALCRAVGVMQPGDASKLHDKPLLITLGVELDDRGRENNVIKKYDPVSGGFAAGSAPVSAPQAVAPAAPITPPWQSK